MLQTLKSTTLMQQKRAHTRSCRKFVEQNPFDWILKASTISTPITSRFPSLINGLEQLCKMRLRKQVSQSGPVKWLCQSRRAPLILQNLVQLGYLVGLPLCLTFLLMRSPQQLLGAIHMLEDSTLDVHVFARHLATVGITGRIYFTSQAERTVPLYKSCS